MTGWTVSTNFPNTVTNYQYIQWADQQFVLRLQHHHQRLPDKDHHGTQGAESLIPQSSAAPSSTLTSATAWHWIRQATCLWWARPPRPISRLPISWSSARDQFRQERRVCHCVQYQFASTCFIQPILAARTMIWLRHRAGPAGNAYVVGNTSFHEFSDAQCATNHAQRHQRRFPGRNHFDGAAAGDHGTAYKPDRGGEFECDFQRDRDRDAAFLLSMAGRWNKFDGWDKHQRFNHQWFNQCHTDHLQCADERHWELFGDRHELRRIGDQFRHLDRNVFSAISHSTTGKPDGWGGFNRDFQRWRICRAALLFAMAERRQT